MNAKLTDNTDGNGTVGWVLYDAACPFCCRWARRSARLLARRGFKALPLQTGWVRRRVQAAAIPLLREMRLLTVDGRLFGGATALLQLARYFWWARPLAWMGTLALVRGGLERLYRFVAHQYHCSPGCSVHRQRTKGSVRGRIVIALSPLVLLRWCCVRLLKGSRQKARKPGGFRKSHRVSSFYRMP